VVSITDTDAANCRATYARVPFGTIATATGPPVTGIVALTTGTAGIVSITDTLFPLRLQT
jgi:hypothetical protein